MQLMLGRAGSSILPADISYYPILWAWPFWGEFHSLCLVPHWDWVCLCLTPVTVVWSVILISFSFIRVQISNKRRKYIFYAVLFGKVTLHGYEYLGIFIPWWTWLRQQDAQGCGCDKWEDDTVSSTVMWPLCSWKSLHFAELHSKTTWEKWGWTHDLKTSPVRH